jgi:hypothetical protein
VTTKISLEDAPVLRPIEDRAPRLEFADAIWRFLGVQLGHAPLIYVLPATHRVGEMHLPIVAIIHIAQRGRDSAFGHNRMRFAEERFANESDRNSSGRCFDGRAQTGAAGADYENIVLKGFVVGHASNER